jgi:glutamate-ammonia-ligase adenylyltransferase
VANSLASAERYYEAFGRAWERAVLLRARPIAGDHALGESLLEIVRPFVFPRRVDPRIAGQMAQMLERSRQELSVDDERDVKLGRGGIREAEFFVQTLQLVWGGRHPELQVAGTLPALLRLVRLGLVSDREARELEAAWALLRRVEHRIHVWVGYQSHSLPEGAELEPFARSLSLPDAGALLLALQGARSTVAQLFRSLLNETARGESKASVLAEQLVTGEPTDEDLARVFADVDPDEARVHLHRLGKQADDPLGPRARERHPDFAPRLLEEIEATADPARALRFTADFFARLRGWDYQGLLEERGALRRFVSLFGTSDALASAVVGHPEDLDVLLQSGAPALAEIAALHRAISLDPLPEPEALVAAARAIKRQLTLRIGLSWNSGELALGEALVLLSALAREQTALALAFSEREHFARFGTPARQDGGAASLVVVALGKLGTGELGWGSDLDLVFLYDEGGETAGPRPIEHRELFTRVAQRTLRLLAQPDVEGPGYEIDTRLRPSGSQGTLVSSLAAFDRYHERAAEAWERLAWMRARPIAGAAQANVAERLAEAAFGGALPEADALAHMRGRIEAELAHEAPDVVHPKLGAGGLVDVEFLTQLLLLRRGHAHGAERRSLLALPTAEALEVLSDRGELSAADHAPLAEGALFLRTVEQSLRLVDEAGDGRLFLRSRAADRVARRLGIRAHAGRSAADVLAEQIHRHRGRIRGIFERLVAPVPQPKATPRQA